MIADIENDFKKRVCDRIRLRPEGINRYRVVTPFRFDDGDHLVIALRKENGSWLLSDEGHTLMHLSYKLDLKDIEEGTRKTIFDNTLSSFSVNETEGELHVEIPGEQYGDALFSFVQALLRITDVTFLSRERVRSTFMEDLFGILTEHVPEPRRTFSWHDPSHDPEGLYLVDCRVNGGHRPLFIHGLPTEAKVQNATISLLRFEQWGIKHRSMAVFENQEAINSKVLARFSDVGGKLFSSLEGNRERIVSYLHDVLEQ